MGGELFKIRKRRGEGGGGGGEETIFLDPLVVVVVVLLLLLLLSPPLASMSHLNRATSVKTRLDALKTKRTIESDAQWRTLKFLLGLPELLQLRKVLVQYEDLGEAQGGHLRWSRLVIG